MTIPKSSKKAEIHIEVESSLSNTIKTALMPEIETPSSERSFTRVLANKNQIIICTEASDTSALRASLNSYLRWIQGIQKIFESIE